MSEVVRPTLNLGLLPRNRSAPVSVKSDGPVGAQGSPRDAPASAGPRDISPTTPRPVNPSKVIEGRLRTSLSSGPDGVNAEMQSPGRDTTPTPTPTSVARNPSGRIPRELSGDSSKTFDSLRRLTRSNSGLSNVHTQ